MSNQGGIGTEKLIGIVSNYENLILTENDVLFIQFVSEKLDRDQLNSLQDWLYKKFTNQVIPKYKKEFNVLLECLRFQNHIEIKNLSKLPEDKVIKIIKMFEWVLKKF